MFLVLEPIILKRNGGQFNLVPVQRAREMDLLMMLGLKVCKRLLHTLSTENMWKRPHTQPHFHHRKKKIKNQKKYLLGQVRMTPSVPTKIHNLANPATMKTKLKVIIFVPKPLKDTKAFHQWDSTSLRRLMLSSLRVYRKVGNE